MTECLAKTFLVALIALSNVSFGNLAEKLFVLILILKTTTCIPYASFELFLDISNSLVTQL